MDKTKFNSCEFNDGEKERIIQTCCAQYIDNSYFCIKRSLYRLSPLTCQQCTLFQDKNENKNQKARADKKE